MLTEHFTKQMSRVIATFGKTAYPKERIDLIFNAIHTLTNPEFESIVTHFISSARSAPLPKDFVDAAIRERKSRLGGDKMAALSSGAILLDCGTCLDCGVCTIREKHSDKEYFIKCDCKHGLQQHWDIPRWDKNLTNNFDLIPMVAEKWKPNDENGFQEKVQHWTLVMNISKIFWKDYALRV